MTAPRSDVEFAISSAPTASRFTPTADSTNLAEFEGRQADVQELAGSSICNADVPSINFTASCDASSAYLMAGQRARES